MNSLLCRFALLVGCVCLVNTVFAQAMGSAPDSAPSSTIQYVRHDIDSLKKLGGGDMIAGMNKLGSLSYELYIATTSNDQGATGWFFFRKFPWNLPVAQPKFEYRQMDDGAITELGRNSYDDGLTKLSNDGWQLVAMTTMKNGGVGWYYFMHEKSVNQNPSSAAPPSEGNLPMPAATGDFSTPRASVETLFAAAAAKNVELLAKCFADNAADEFKPFKTKSASQKDLDEFAAMFQGARIESDETSGSKSVVSVKLQSRSDEIELSKTAEGWKVVDF